tara:strand:+ start:9762 stop:9947 length:186 start_codon:yes stop_codon:yes gene_type:complete
MDRVKLNHEVGSVYIPLDRRRKAEHRFEGAEFDETFMQGVIGSFIGSMVIFGTLFAIVVIL